MSKLLITGEEVNAFHLMSKAQQEDYVRAAILNLGDPNKLVVGNGLIGTYGMYETPHDEFVHYMSQPQNFWFTCKWLFNIKLHPFQLAILQELWQRKFPMLIASRGAGKTFLLAIYALLRALFMPGSKIVIVGAAFRQSKLMFEYIDNIYRNSPILQSITDEHPKRDIDQCFFKVGQSIIIAIPIGDGQKIRGLRANYVISDEFASIPLEVFEVVIKGFGAVSANPTERADKFATIDLYKQLGLDMEAADLEDSLGFGNQTIISGTAYYSFNHFFQYWKKYKSIVESCGDRRRLEDIFQGKIEDGFDWRQYSVMRIPYTMLPKGFMDESLIAQSRATVHKSIFNMEYGAVFADDSDGFFKRSLVEQCVTKEPIVLPSGNSVTFYPSLTGDPNGEFVFGIDPASESDNFAIVVLQVFPDHRRIVYCWSLNKQKLRERLNNSDSKIGFYNYCARKVRDLLKIFPSKHIGIDSQGGGLTLMETLHNPTDMLPGERPLWPYMVQNQNPQQPDPFWWEAENKPTDIESGDHYLHSINFALSEFTSQANHGLKKDFESRVTLFPAFDSSILAEAIANDQILKREYDTLEDCVMEIEELKDELATIEMSQTAVTNRERWDTPEVKKAGGKKGRLRKDRYSALIIANMLARAIENRLKGNPHQFVGGFAQPNKIRSYGQLYTGPEHLTKQLQLNYRGINRN